MSLAQSFNINFRVYVEDTDLMDIMYHANYLRFFDRARTEMFRHWGLSLTTLAEDNYHFAIKDAQIRYCHPARLDDQLTIKTKLSNQSACSLSFTQNMANAADKLLCEAAIKVVCVNKVMKMQRLPKQFFCKHLEEV